MKFTCNTKPLSDALALGVINSNVSNFNQKSCTVQLTAEGNQLKINIEAANIRTEMLLKGHGEGGPASVFIDSLLFKNLCNTIDTSTVVLEFDEGGLILHSGKSQFKLAKMLDNDQFDLEVPEDLDDVVDPIVIDQSDWKFIKDYQMYAISMAFITPVYTKVWLGNDGDVLVGDFDNSLFTHSRKSKLGKTCLLSDTIINLFNSLPEGSRIVPKGDSYIIHLKNDSFEYRTQFTPLYEDNPEVGSYNSGILLSMMQHPEDSVKINVSAVTKILNQALMLASNSQDHISLSVKDSQLALKDKNVDCSVAVEGELNIDFDVNFNLDRLKKVIANYSEEVVSISPYIKDDEVVGVIVWSPELTTLVAGME